MESNGTSQPFISIQMERSKSVDWLTFSIDVKYVPLSLFITLKTSAISFRNELQSFITSTSSTYGITSSTFASFWRSLGKMYMHLKIENIIITLFIHNQHRITKAFVLVSHVNASQNETDEWSITFHRKLLLHVGLRCDIGPGWIRLKGWMRMKPTQ